ncbi:hypothetical protein CBOM_04070 [Ceraceosorus bombacis]|uniref:Uncharacterized protein n=1 Tax=Ceraceosorus bombacis TaxID=401625 RepID=A0A0P1BLQ4_9BASI|nr:hypothetical protein CBOM_04070 [Ceraceosorus bombacis]
MSFVGNDLHLYESTGLIIEANPDRAPFLNVEALLLKAPELSPLLSCSTLRVAKS